MRYFHLEKDLLIHELAWISVELLMHLLYFALVVPDHLFDLRLLALFTIMFFKEVKDRISSFLRVRLYLLVTEPLSLQCFNLIKLLLHSRIQLQHRVVFFRELALVEDLLVEFGHRSVHSLSLLLH